MCKYALKLTYAHTHSTLYHTRRLHMYRCIYFGSYTFVNSNSRGENEKGAMRKRTFRMSLMAL